jgi:NitT/TauT family transport system substrate-binding protein
MAAPTRRQFLRLLLASCGAIAVGSIVGCAGGAGAPASTPTAAGPTPVPSAEKLDQLIVKGTPGPLTIPIAHAAQSDALKALAKEVVFDVWKTPDQLRADITSNRLHVAMATSNVPANLYRRGMPVQLFSVMMVEGMFSVMSTNPAVKGWSDVKGHKLALAYKDDMPDLLFRIVMKANALDPAKDVEMQYTSTPSETMQLLLAGKVDVAMVAEPQSTAAEIKAKQSGVSLSRVLDLTAEWGKATGGSPRIPMAGAMAVASLAKDHPKIVLAMQGALAESTVWTMQNQTEAAKLGADKLALEAPVLEKSLSHLRLEAVSATQARQELEAFFGKLMDLSAEVIGGGLPDDGFYFSAK